MNNLKKECTTKVEEGMTMVQVTVIINIVMATLKTIKMFFDKHVI
jgi:hypothetical protein